MAPSQLPILSWLRLALALLIFLGPGYLLLQLSPLRKNFDRTFSLILSLGFSLGVWTVMLALFQPLGVRFSPSVAVGVFAACGLAGIGLRRPWREGRNIRLDPARLTLWAILLLTFLLRIWDVRHEVAGLGSDSYHHTLFAQMIFEQGAIPWDYGANTPVMTFTYHFGFHAWVAFLGWVSAIPMPTLVLILSPVLVALAGAALAFAAETMTQNRLAGLLAAAFAALFNWYPAHMLTWGRYPQLLGLIGALLFVALFWVWLQNGLRWNWLAWLAVLVAGIALVHYRVVLLTGLGAAVLALVYAVGIYRWVDWKRMILRGLALAVAVVALVSPWLIHIWLARQVGHVVTFSGTAEFFSLTRSLGGIFNYPTTLPGLVLTVLLGGVALLRRERLAFALLLWFGLALIPSRSNGLMDINSLLISVFVPQGLLLALGLNQLQGWLRRFSWPGWVQPAFGGLLVAGLLLGGVWADRTVPKYNDGLLRPEDLPAMQFIREHTPTDAHFMINIYRFPFSDILMVGNDAGYFIPLLTGRQTVVQPMTFSFEHLRSPEYPDQLRRLEGLEGEITSEQALMLMREAGVTHVYLGTRGGKIQPESLQNSPHFRLLYQDGPTYVFEVIY